MTAPFFFAYKFLKGSRSDSTISSMVLICFLSILVGTAALTLVAFIMNGFETATHAKLKGIHSDLLIRSSKPLNYKKVAQIFSKEFGASVSASSPSSMAQLIIEHEQGQKKTQMVVALKGIDPDREPKVTTLHKMITDPASSDLNMLLKPNTIVMGASLQKDLQLKKGQKVSLLVASDEVIKKDAMCLEYHDAIVAGFFKTGIEELDEHIIFCSLPFFDKLFDTGVTQINIALKNPSQDAAVKQQLQERLSLPVFSWKDLYPAIVSALSLEKYVMFLILCIMTFVASMNVMSLLYMLITQKRWAIALCKSMGADNQTIISIFIIIGLGLTLTATLGGIVLALLVSLILWLWPISLPDAYYVNYLPIAVDLKIILVILLIMTIIGLLATIIPTRGIKNIGIAQVLKNEFH